ncbi:MAG: hypothetical protein ABIR06_02980 [Cyclobacteriaceae bacterium]
MKKKYLILTGLILSSLQVFAQHPLVGTWQMVSMKGTDFDGKKISLTTSMAREIKIITPTHYMLIAHDVKGDSLVFSRSHAGLMHFKENQFIETQKIASWDNPEPASLPFHWKVEGDKFIQSGKITRADGKTAMLEELVFERIKGKASYPGNPSNGTWDQLSSRYTLGDGKEESHTNKTATRFQIITPTHWIRINHRNNKFESAMAGTYRMEGNKVYSLLEQASYPIKEGEKFEFTQRVEGDKLYISGKAVLQDGNTLIWDDVFQKVGGDPLK